MAAAYFWFLEAIGTSPGKQLVGLFVVRSPSWRRPGALAGLLRLLGKLLIVLSLGARVALSRLDRERRMLHETMSGTRVLRR